MRRNAKEITKSRKKKRKIKLIRTTITAVPESFEILHTFTYIYVILVFCNKSTKKVTTVSIVGCIKLPKPRDIQSKYRNNIQLLTK